MKKIFVIFFASLFSLGFIAQNAMAVKPSGEEMVVGVFIGSEPVPPLPPPTAKEIKEINRELLREKDAKTAKAYEKLAGKDGVLEKTKVAVEDIKTELIQKNKNDEQIIGKFATFTDNTGKEVGKIKEAVNKSADSTIGFVAAIGVLLLLAIGGSAWYVSHRIGFVKEAVDEIPEKTADAVLSPWDFDIAGHTVTWRPASLVDIQEIHVPRGASGDPASFIRNIELREGVARRNFRKTMRLYYEGKFDAPEYSLQKALIEYLIDAGEIKAPKKAA